MRKLLLLTAILAVSFDITSAQSARTGEGHEIEIRLHPERSSIMISEPTFIRFELSNYSSEELCVVSGGDYRNNIGRPDSFKVYVAKDDGTKVFQPQVTFLGGGLIGCDTMPAHGKAVEILFLPHWAKFETVGLYTINVQKELLVRNYKTKSTSRITANATAQLRVVADDQDKFGKLIDSLGLTMLGHTRLMVGDEGREANNAILALSYIHDKRTIKYLALALEQFNGPVFDSRALTAAHALGKYNDDVAINALATAINSKHAAVRDSVAHALRFSQHPMAESLLVKMWNDPDIGVRFKVAIRLGGSKSIESLKLLNEMLQDTNEYVRQAAHKSLNARTSPD